jgi:hypothetical protein
LFDLLITPTLKNEKKNHLSEKKKRRLVSVMFFKACEHYGTFLHVVLGGVMAVVLVTGTKVRGFKLCRVQWISKGDKIPWHNFLRSGSKAVGPM